MADEINLSYIYLMINLKIKLIRLTLAIHEGHLKATLNTVLKHIGAASSKSQKGKQC